MGLFGAACGAVYPEMRTPVRPPPPAELVEAEIPDDLYFIYIEKALIPVRTRDGRAWNPNPYARLLVNGAEILSTPVESGNRRPEWKSQRLANYRIPHGADISLEVWDSTPVTDHPVCNEVVLDLQEMRAGAAGLIDCDSGARVWLHVEPARPLLGAGLYYELRGPDGVRVTRVAARSPAERAGLRAGDQIIKIQGELVKGMDAFAVRSRMNSNVRQGLKLDLRTVQGDWRTVELLEGPIFPLSGDDLELPQVR